ncbi:unnamed protein product, partial [Ectocarpus sp. 12 AP-2014]
MLSFQSSYLITLPLVPCTQPKQKKTHVIIVPPVLPPPLVPGNGLTLLLLCAEGTFRPHSHTQRHRLFPHFVVSCLRGKERWETNMHPFTQNNSFFLPFHPPS